MMRYEAYLYRYTHIPTERIYIGIHKGMISDEYNHSSTDEEFASLLRNSREDFCYEILRTGSYNTMRNEEHKMLKAVNAKSNPMYFNKSNGSPASKGVNREAVKELADDILNRQGVLTDAKEIAKSAFLQVRAADDRNHKLSIQNAIDDAHGDTVSLGLCAVLLDDYFDESDEEYGIDGSFGVGGNHSTRATVDSKHGKEIPVIRVCREEWEHLNDTEIEFLGMHLNKPESVIDPKRNQPDDLNKMIETMYFNEHIDPLSDEMIEILVDLNIPRRNAKNIAKKAKKLIEVQEMNMVGQKMIDYTVEPHKSKLAQKINQLRADGTTLAYTITSGSGGSLQTLLRNVKDDLIEGQHTNIKVLVRHALPSFYEEWNNGQKGIENQEMFTWALEPRGLDVEFFNLPHIQKDVQFSTMDLD